MVNSCVISFSAFLGLKLFGSRVVGKASNKLTPCWQAFAGNREGGSPCCWIAVELQHNTCHEQMKILPVIHVPVSFQLYFFGLLLDDLTTF